MERNSHNDLSLNLSSSKPSRENFLGELFRFALIALIIVLPIRMFIAQPFIVSGASMEETFSSGEYLIVDQLTYHFEEPERGDIVILRYPNDPSKYFIKRVIGIPGDTVSIEENMVTIENTAEGIETVLDEPYVHTSESQREKITRTLGVEEYYVLGDNRDASSDSRVWGILPRENIVGRAYVRLFPLSEIGVLPGAYDINAQLK